MDFVFRETKFCIFVMRAKIYQLYNLFFSFLLGYNDEMLSQKSMI